MVSWNNEPNDLERVSPEREHITNLSQSMIQIFWLARQSAWEELISTLQKTPPEIIQCAVEDSEDDLDSSSSILHVVVTSTEYSKLPLAVIQTILDLANELACKSNANQQTPLHLAVQYMPDRTDIVECLVEAAPSVVRQVDDTQQRPIDILCRKIIMLEEYCKYSSHPKERTLEVMQVWETVHVLAKKCANPSDSRIPEQEPIITACLLATDFPFALTERAVKRYRKQLLEPSVHGDLPLHVIASMPPPPKGNEDDDDDDDDVDDDEEIDFLDRVLSLCPEAASRRNRQNQIPLMLAIENGRGWNSGLARLLDANPSGVHDLQIPLQLFPKVLEQLWNNSCEETTFAILQARPEIFIAGRDLEVSRRYEDVHNER
jgi:hypothetical protein